jgi:hypothetical protein
VPDELEAAPLLLMVDRVAAPVELEARDPLELAEVPRPEVAPAVEELTLLEPDPLPHPTRNAISAATSTPLFSTLARTRSAAH